MTTQRRIIDPATGQYPPSEVVVWGINHKPFGPRSKVIYGDDYVLTLGFDQSYRLTGQEDKLSTTVLRDLSLGWSNRDNLASVTDNLVSASSETFTYNPREFLRKATGPYDELTFSYNQIGSRRQLDVDDGSTTVSDIYSYPSTSNRLQSIALAAGQTPNRAPRDFIPQEQKRCLDYCCFCGPLNFVG